MSRSPTEFARGLAERMGALKVGRGTEPDTDVGPLIDEAQRDKVEELVGDAVERGARRVIGGGRLSGPAHPGYFFEPTVLADVPADARLLREEIFGPVAPIATFSTEEQALAAANLTEYGLVAYVYTRDLARAFRVVRGHRDRAWSASTRASSRTPPPPSGASSSPGSDARVASRGSASTWRRSTWLSAFEQLREEPLPEHAQAE